MRRQKFKISTTFGLPMWRRENNWKNSSQRFSTASTWSSTMHTTENRIYCRGQLGRNRKYWVCMYVCMYCVCMYVYINVSNYCVYMYVCMEFVETWTCMYVCMYVCITIFTHEEDLSAFKNLSLCMYCVYVYIWIMNGGDSSWPRLQTSLLLCVWIYVCMYACEFASGILSCIAVVYMQRYKYEYSPLSLFLSLSLQVREACRETLCPSSPLTWPRSLFSASGERFSFLNTWELWFDSHTTWRLLDAFFHLCSMYVCVCR